jgi:hypothetical protein
VQGNQYNANRDLIQTGGDYVGGDKIDAQGAQGFVNRPTGPVSQQFGDTVGGNKSSGDINVRDVSGSGIAIGHGAQAQSQQGEDAETVARIFAPIYRQIEGHQSPDAVKAVLAEHLRQIENEARKGEQANAQQLEGGLAVIASMAGDIFEVTIAALTGPQAAVATVVRQVAAKVQQERRQR